MNPPQPPRVRPPLWLDELIDQADALFQSWQLAARDLDQWIVSDLIQHSVDTLDLVNQFYDASRKHSWEQEALNDHESIESKVFHVAKTMVDTLWNIRDVFQEIRDGPHPQALIQEWQWRIIREWTRKLEMRRPDEQDENGGQTTTPVQEETRLVLR